MPKGLSVCTVFVLATALSSCDTSSPVAARSTRAVSHISYDEKDYPIFPGKDSGADPSVAPEDGGKGFVGRGWETSTDFKLIGDPSAYKTGMLRQAVTDFPSTLRPQGPGTTAFNYTLGKLVYETLLTVHPNTMHYVPVLATHWQISSDKSTYRFRIDPNARWSDGVPVTAADVVASWVFWMDKGLRDPLLQIVFGKFDKPVAESKYIVRVRSNTDGWRNFMVFSSNMIILPAHVVSAISGDAYVRDYNYKMLPGSGPYMVDEKDVDRGNTIRIRRRTDYWAANYRRNVGLYNFNEIRVIVVRNRNLEFEMFQRGDLDYYNVLRAAMWAEQLNFAQVNRGLVQKRRIWNQKPIAFGGMAMNTRRPPYDDVRLRKALRHLFNRELLIEKLMYGEYTAMDSYWPGSIYENPDNEKIRYDPETALRLLSEAGWNQRDNQGKLTKNGAPLVLELLYTDRLQEQFFTVFQEDLHRVGITLNLRLVPPETLIKLADQRQFGMAAVPIGTFNYDEFGFPAPESLLSVLADEPGTRNITGFKNRRVDELIAQYQSAYSVEDRAGIIRTIDALFTREHHWIMLYYAPYERITFWNKFGAPKGYLTRTGNYQDIMSLWWIDPTNAADLERAKHDSTMTFKSGETDDKYWLNAAAYPKRLEIPAR